ncbi:MAG: hypothetical protein WD397_04185 [Wenzhouxiangellaceae bacterium]
MKLARLTIDKLPGIDGGLVLAPAPDRVSVVVGPNASGKTSLIRALAALLQRRPDNQPVQIEAEFSDGEHRIKGSAIGQARTWSLDGVGVDRPDWPGDEQMAAYLIRADELADAGATEQQFSDALRRVMAGGYDLDTLARTSGFERPARPQKLAREYDQAERRMQELEARHAGLVEEIDHLASLREQQRESIEAQRRLQAQKRALELLGLEQQLAAARQALEQFPEGMHRLDGREGERLERLDEEIEQRRQRLDRTRQARADAERTLAQAGIKDIDTLEAFAADLAEHRQQLQALERKLEDSRQQYRDLGRARETAARRAGHLKTEDASALDDVALDGLEKLAERVRSTQANIQALAKETDWRGRHSPDPEELADLDSGIGALRDWLASPPATPAGWVVWSLLLAGAAGAAGWAWFELDRPLLAAIAAAAGLMPLSHVAVLAGRAIRTSRHRARFETTRFDPPARWQRPEVAQWLQQLQARLAECLRQKSEAARTEELVAELDSAQTRLESERRQLEMAADRLQIRTEWVLETTGQLRLRALLELHEADGRLEQTRGAIADRQREIDALVDRVRTAFEQAAQQAPAEISGQTLGSFLNRLNPRLAEARSARIAIDNAEARLGELEDEIERLVNDRRALFSNAGLAEEDGQDKRNALRDRLRRFAQWSRLRDELAGLEKARLLSTEALDQDRDLLEMAQARDEAGLVQLGEQLAAAANQRDELAERIATIESEQKAALEQRELERLNAERERLRTELEKSMESHRDAEAAQLLIERARSGYSRQHQPALFTRARELFGRMTRTRFELTFDGEQFAARDQAMAEQRSIAELSTATRIQLLLALRLAWIDEAERQGPSLPIFLDEVLATTDPERYRAVVEALQELVRSGRQVIYLSSQPADAQAWQRFAGEPAPEIIELAPNTDEAFGFELPEPPTCPDPGLDADDWAEQAGVAPLDPWRGAEALELFHLLRDRLEALNALRGFGVITLGQFEHARELALGLPIEDDTAQVLDRRIRAARAWLERWRRGHVPPVGEHQLIKSEAVSPKFIEQVIALNRELSGSGKELIEALRNGEVSGFFKRKIDELEQELAGAGLLDQPHVPADAELTDTLARAGGLDSDHAARLNRWLKAALG